MSKGLFCYVESDVIPRGPAQLVLSSLAPHFPTLPYTTLHLSSSHKPCPATPHGPPGARPATRATAAIPHVALSAGRTSNSTVLLADPWPHRTLTWIIWKS